MGKAMLWLSPTQFHEHARRHPTAVKGIGIYKAFTPEIKDENPEARTIRFRISTGAVDRERDVIKPTGWKLDEYKRNPTVLFAHDYTSLPIAKAIELSQDQQGLSAVAEFASIDLYPFADTVYRMVRAGFLNATSVGFKPIEWSYNEDRRGVDFSAQSLLEFSVVPVPANSECLVEARNMGIDTLPLKEWAEKILDTWNDESGLYVPREQAEAVWRFAGNGRTTYVALDPTKPIPGQEKPPEGFRSLEHFYGATEEFQYGTS